MLNYHELTMNEPRNSPARRKQFTVISSIMTVMTIHAGLQAGVFAPLNIERASGDGDNNVSRFPGGEFVYKFMTKDYAATTGALRTVSSDLGIAEKGAGNLILEEGVPTDTADLLYSVLLDDATSVAGGKTRFAAGALIDDSEEGERMKKKLLDANESIGLDTDGDRTHSSEVRYEVGRLPAVEAAVAQHPFTAGAWSAVLQSYKIAPKFKKYAEENGMLGKDVVIVSTCSAAQSMCTYYMPLSKQDEFYLGRSSAEEYARQFDTTGMFEFMGVELDEHGSLSIGGISPGNVFRGMKLALLRFIGGGGSEKKSSSSDGEL